MEWSSHARLGTIVKLHYDSLSFQIKGVCSPFQGVNWDCALVNFVGPHKPHNYLVFKNFRLCSIYLLSVLPAVDIVMELAS